MGIKRRCIIEGMIANLLDRMEVELVEKVVVLERPIKDFHGRVAVEGYLFHSVRLIYIPAMIMIVSIVHPIIMVFPRMYCRFSVPFVFVVPESGKGPRADGLHLGRKADAHDVSSVFPPWGIGLVIGFLMVAYTYTFTNSYLPKPFVMFLGIFPHVVVRHGLCIDVEFARLGVEPPCATCRKGA